MSYVTTIVIPEKEIKPVQGIHSDKTNELGFEEISASCQRISGTMYLVKNHGGFNAALYNYTIVVRGYERFSKKEIRGMVDNYPVKYPCLIALADDFFERNVIFVDVADSGIFGNVAHSNTWVKDC